MIFTAFQIGVEGLKERNPDSEIMLLFLTVIKHFYQRKVPFDIFHDINLIVFVLFSGVKCNTEEICNIINHAASRCQ